jgi:hypothetical protein
MLQVLLASSGNAKATFPLYFTYMPVWPARQSKIGFFSRILFAPACIFLLDKGRISSARTSPASGVIGG